MQCRIYPDIMDIMWSKDDETFKKNIQGDLNWLHKRNKEILSLIWGDHIDDDDDDINNKVICM
jgi:hypothetical protein